MKAFVDHKFNVRGNCNATILSFIHSFINSGDVHRASSRDYYSETLQAQLRPKKKDFHRDVKFGRVGRQQGTQLKGRSLRSGAVH